MRSHESTSALKSPPAMTDAELGGRHNSLGFLTLSSEAQDLRRMQPVIGGVDANGMPMLSPAQQLKELVESESQRKASVQLFQTGSGPPGRTGTS